MREPTEKPFWRSRFFRFLFLASVFLGGAYFFFTRGSSFDIADIQVRTDGELSPEILLAAADIPEKTNFFKLDTEAVRQRIQAIPRVRKVTVNRYFPGAVTIIVEERVGKLWLSCPSRGIHPEGSGQRVVVDEKGVAFAIGDSGLKAGDLPILHLGVLAEFEDGKPLPSQTGLTAAKILELCQKSPIVAAGNIQAFRELNDYSVRSDFDSGLSAVFGVTEVERQVANLGSILENAAQAGKKVATVNLVTMKNIAVTF